MKIKYMKVTQKNESFYVVKMKATDMRNIVNFHFRNPYSNEKNTFELYENYIRRIESAGIEITNSDIGIQRRLDATRIKSIKKYLETSEEGFFPNSVILALDPFESDYVENIDEIEGNDFGEIHLKEGVKFQVVDGQHRLAGLFISEEYVQKNFEILAVLLISATPEVCAKVFSDVNGTQTKVNKSVIYDLLGIVKTNTTNEFQLKILHDISNQLNSDIESPLYKHIKMLGIGSGAISQAFFIESLQYAINDNRKFLENPQYFYERIYMYLRAFQRNFPKDWPVKQTDDLEEFYDYSKYVLRTRKSQLLKTNGFGAIMRLYPYIDKMVNVHSYKSYDDLIKRLVDKIDWVYDISLTSGTGDKNQKAIKEKLLNILQG